MKIRRVTDTEWDYVSQRWRKLYGRRGTEGKFDSLQGEVGGSGRD